MTRTGRAATTIAVAGGLCLERWGRTTRATRAEKRASLPGDDAVSDPQWQLTRAITIAAPPAQVWPWLVQMGYPKFRARWYAPYCLDRIVWRIKDRSAERIIPELQTLTVGDRIPDSPDWSAFFTVLRLEPERALVLYSTTHPLPMYTDVQFGWSFVLDDHHGSTRLIMRARMHYTRHGSSGADHPCEGAARQIGPSARDRRHPQQTGHHQRTAFVWPGRRRASLRRERARWRRQVRC
jgi:hypothetical protein